MPGGAVKQFLRTVAGQRLPILARQSGRSKGKSKSASPHTSPPSSSSSSPSSSSPCHGRSHTASQAAAATAGSQEAARLRQLVQHCSSEDITAGLLPTPSTYTTVDKRIVLLPPPRWPQLQHPRPRRQQYLLPRPAFAVTHCSSRVRVRAPRAFTDSGSNPIQCRTAASREHHRVQTCKPTSSASACSSGPAACVLATAPAVHQCAITSPAAAEPPKHRGNCYKQTRAGGGMPLTLVRNIQQQPAACRERLRLRLRLRLRKRPL